MYPHPPPNFSEYIKKEGASIVLYLNNLPECEDVFKPVPPEVFGASILRFHRYDNVIKIDFCDERGSDSDFNYVKKTLQKYMPNMEGKFWQLFPFIRPQEEALEFEDEVLKIKEKCKSNISSKECKECMEKKKDDCWIRIISKLTNTNPNLHSGYEVADCVIYDLSQAIYFVIKAKPIKKLKSEGDVLFRQCSSLFSRDNAIVFYLNPYETANHIIEKIREAASNYKTNPSFGVIPPRYIRQMYKKYKSTQ